MEVIHTDGRTSALAELPRPEHATNVGDVERWASVVGGGALAIYGLARLGRDDRAAPLYALLGSLIAWRGISGHSHLYEGLHVSRFDGEGSAANAVRGPAIKVERSITVQRPAPELWRFWRNLENLPRFVEHVESVLPLGGNRFHWTVDSPIGAVSWDAEIIGEREGEYVAWRSLEGSEIPNAGSVHFTPGAGGTEVRVSLAYKPPAGPLGAMIARVIGREPEGEVDDALERFKQVMEHDEGARVETRRW